MDRRAITFAAKLRAKVAKRFSLFNFEGTTSERLSGGLAQLGERLPCKQEVSGSIPLISTRAAKLKPHLKPSASGFKWERKQSEVNELWTKREAIRPKRTIRSFC